MYLYPKCKKQIPWNGLWPMYVHQISCSVYSLKLASIPSHEEILAKFKIMLKIGFVSYINTADLCAFYILSHLIPSSNAFSCRKGGKKMSGESRAAAVGHLFQHEPVSKWQMLLNNIWCPQMPWQFYSSAPRRWVPEALCFQVVCSSVCSSRFLLLRYLN